MMMGWKPRERETESIISLQLTENFVEKNWKEKLFSNRRKLNFHDFLATFFFPMFAQGETKIAKLKNEKEKKSVEELFLGKKATIELSYDSFATLFPRENSIFFPLTKLREVPTNDPLISIDYLVYLKRYRSGVCFFSPQTNKTFNKSLLFMKKKK